MSVKTLATQAVIPARQWIYERGGAGGGGSAAPSPSVSLGTNGQVNTSGSDVTWVSGDKFSTAWVPGTKILIGGVEYTIQSVPSPTHLIVNETLPTLTSAWYAVGTEVLVRNNDLIEVDIWYTPPASNWNGAAIYIEDPDISSRPVMKLDGSVPADGTSGVSGKWTPLRLDDTVTSPAAVLFPAEAVDRNVRIYLASYGPDRNPVLVRANDTTPGAVPTPSVVVTLQAQQIGYVSGIEHAWTVTDVDVSVNTKYNQATPKYSLTFKYRPPNPDLEAHLPPGMKNFGGVDIYLKNFNDGSLLENGIHKYQVGVDPVGQIISWTSEEWDANKGSLRVYFVSVDVDYTKNSIVDGITPYKDVTIDPTVGVKAPDVLSFAINNHGFQWRNGVFVAEAAFTWAYPTDGSMARFSGMFLYVVATTGSETVPFPLPNGGPILNSDTSRTIVVANYPMVPEIWTVAAISADVNGVLAYDPKNPGAIPAALKQAWNPVGGTTPAAPGVTVLTISNQSLGYPGIWTAYATFSWTLPSDTSRLGGVNLYRVGGSTQFPVPEIIDQSRGTGTSLATSTIEIPAVQENWIVAAIAYDLDGHLVDDPSKYNVAGGGFHSPTVTWTLGGPPPAPSPLQSLTVTDHGVVWYQNGGFVVEGLFNWTLPTNLARYSGLRLYRVKATPISGTSTTPVPFLLYQAGNKETSGLGTDPRIPPVQEDWVVAAITLDETGKMTDDPATYANSLKVTWTVKPGAPGSGGLEYASAVTLIGGAKVTVAEKNSSDGIRLAQFTISGPAFIPPGPPSPDAAWTNPTTPANQFGGVTVAMAIEGDLIHAVFWDAPFGATSFITPWIGAPGTYGSTVNLKFYLVSRDQQGKRNSLTTNTPGIGYAYTPTKGQIQTSLMPSNWFNTAEFSWPNKDTGGLFTANVIQSGKISVGAVLRVGDAPAGSGLDPSFVGQNGQIAVYSAPPTGKSFSVLQAWMGKQNNALPGGGFGTIYGGWFSALYVGGSDPTTASFFVNNGGVVQIGGWDVTSGTDQNGIAFTYYPYITLRDKTNTEQGRLGASIGTVTNNITGGHNFNLQGAWFNQIAIGGNAWNQWKILTDDLGDIWMRDVRSFVIDYPQNLTSAPKNYEYIAQFGKSIWGGAGLAANSFQFPGWQIYKVEIPAGPAYFGMMLVNRGLVLRGTKTYNNNVIGSLVMYNGTATGDDSPDSFWGELSLYSPTGSNVNNVSLASGAAGTGASHFRLGDASGSMTFNVNETGDATARTFYVGGYANQTPVIDSGGNWVGPAIASNKISLTPWNTTIDANNQALNNVKQVVSYNYSAHGASGYGFALFDPPSSGVPDFGLYGTTPILRVGTTGNTNPLCQIQKDQIYMQDATPRERLRLDYSSGLKLADSSGNNWFFMQMGGSEPLFGLGLAAGYYMNLYGGKFEMHSGAAPYYGAIIFGMNMTNLVQDGVWSPTGGFSGYLQVTITTASGVTKTVKIPYYPYP